MVNHLPCKPSGLSLGPQNPRDAGVVVQLPVFTLGFCWEMKGDPGELWEVCGPASLAYAVAATESLSQTRRKVGTNT